MTIRVDEVDGVRIFEADGTSNAIAVDYTEILDIFDQRFEAIETRIEEQNQLINNLVDEAKTANGLFAGMLQQLTRLANCTCTPCSNIDMCEVTEKILKEDGII